MPTSTKLAALFILATLVALIPITGLQAAERRSPGTVPDDTPETNGYRYLTQAEAFSGTTIILGEDALPCLVETLVWGITRSGKIGLAVCVGRLKDGTAYDIVNPEAFDRLAYSTGELVGGIFDFSGHDVRVRNIEFAVDPVGRVLLFALEGEWVETGKKLSYAHAVTRGATFTPDCCSFYTGATACDPLPTDPCDDPGSCTGPPRSCACLPVGNGCCVATLGSLCGGGCGGNCPPGTCAFWNGEGGPACECRGS